MRAQTLQHCSTEPFLRWKFSAKPCNTPNVILGAYQIPLRIVKEFNDLWHNQQSHSMSRQSAINCSDQAGLCVWVNTPWWMVVSGWSSWVQPETKQGSSPKYSSICTSSQTGIVLVCHACIRLCSRLLSLNLDTNAPCLAVAGLRPGHVAPNRGLCFDTNGDTWHEAAPDGQLPVAPVATRLEISAFIANISIFFANSIIIFIWSLSRSLLADPYLAWALQTNTQHTTYPSQETMLFNDCWASVLLSA